jgi:hypothetical protein
MKVRGSWSGTYPSVQRDLYYSAAECKINRVSCTLAEDYQAANYMYVPLLEICRGFGACCGNYYQVISSWGDQQISSACPN